MRAAAWDVVIIGGGVMGCSVAYHLAVLGKEALRVLVLERDPTYATASSALSLGSIRQQFSTPLNIAMSRYGIEFVREAAERLACGEQAVDLGFRPGAYLFLADAEGADELRRGHALQVACGAAVALIEPDEMARRLPWLVADDLACATLGLRDEGWFDGYSLLNAFRHKALALGVEFRVAEVTELGARGGRVAEVGLADGRRISAADVVNAAGPQAGEIARLAGLELPVRPQVRSVFVVDCPAASADWPLVIDPSGVYVRPEGQGFLVGAPAPAGLPDGSALAVDHDAFETVVWPTLAARIPAFETLRLQSAWAGAYDMNTIDQNAIIGRAPGLENFWLINGFSGHGMQHAPAAGRGVAELLLWRRFESLDLTELGFDRLTTPAPTVERKVI